MTRVSSVCFFGVVVGVVGVVVGGCDVRPTLAQLAFFSGTREELVQQCCECLAVRGTGAADASCEEGVFQDGVIVVPDGAVTGDGDRSSDLDDDVEPGEVPCLCGGGGVDRCVNDLVSDKGIVVPGACIDQVDAVAPCESACAGVLSFEPVASE